MGLRPVKMAGRLGLSLTEYQALEAGHCTSTTTCTSGSPTCASDLVEAHPRSIGDDDAQSGEMLTGPIVARSVSRCEPSLERFDGFHLAVSPDLAQAAPSASRGCACSTTQR